MPAAASLGYASGWAERCACGDPVSTASFGRTAALLSRRSTTIWKTSAPTVALGSLPKAAWKRSSPHLEEVVITPSGTTSFGSSFMLPPLVTRYDPGLPY